MLVGEYYDLRHIHGVFWPYIDKLLYTSRQLVKLGREPTRDECKLFFPSSVIEVGRQWKWITRFREHEYNPKEGDEIAVFVDGWPENGTHRACALRALHKPVPSLIFRRRLRQ